MNCSGIYAIVNLLTYDMYVGSAVSIANRWRSHLHHLRKGTHHCAHLQNAYRKYTPDAFSFELVEIVPDKANLIEKEQFWLDLFRPTYNKRRIANSCLWSKRSPEFCAHMSRVQKGRKQTPETIAKRSLALKGRARPDHVREKIRLSKIGVKPSAETRAKLSLAKQRLRQDINP